MICILAKDYREAEIWARGQRFHRLEWFFGDEHIVSGFVNFHIIRLPGYFGLPASYIDRLDALVEQRKNRK